MNPSWIRPLFVLAAAYDLALGIGVLLFFRPLYVWAGITPPNHDAYVQFGAAVVVVMGLGFALVAANPAANRGLMLMGVLFKFAYALPVLGHYFFGSMPVVWTVFAWCDLAFAAGFAWAMAATRTGGRGRRGQ